MKNVFVSTDILGDDSMVQFCDIDHNEGAIYFDNITISHVCGENLFTFSHSYQYDVDLNNIVLENVCGGYLFYFHDNYYSAISMTNIFVNGNDKYLYSQLLFLDYGSLTVENAVFSNLILDTSSVIPFYFNQAVSSDYIYFRNVSFTNLTSVGSTYGLISIYDDFNVVIDTCTFENNQDFVGLVHCRSSSYCNVTVKNSLFRSNSFDANCVGTFIYANGIYFEDNVYGLLTLDSNTFDESPYVRYDSTTTVTMDNNIVFNNSTIASRDYSANLYISVNGTDSDDNDCVNSANPCATWFDPIC